MPDWYLARKSVIYGYIHAVSCALDQLPMSGLLMSGVNSGKFVLTSRNWMNENLTS